MDVLKQHSSNIILNKDSRVPVSSYPLNPMTPIKSLLLSLPTIDSIGLLDNSNVTNELKALDKVSRELLSKCDKI